ncbi:alpha/beta fold hydrolase [Ruegeria halocynthiae]|uniref:alpha/beta fold hydrolase n=1 Tax=Ruegeria halocynthiae TaxID=985054 RepID=UPI0005699E65|nr:alpha/beta hydrolase [Ruegeria halocynthiae]
MLKTLKYLAIAIGVLIGAGAIWFWSIAVTSLSREDLALYDYDTLVLPDGMNVNYRVQGNPQGQTLLMVHGGGGSIDDWNVWLPTLEPDYYIVSIDLPGHGLTDPLPDDDYGPKRFAVFIKDVVAALDLQDFVIVGHSFGGDSVVRYVLDNPDTPVAMVLVSSGGFMPRDDQISDTEKELLEWAANPVVQKLLPFLQDRASVKEGMESYFHDASVNTEAYTDKVYNLLRYEKNRGVLVKLLVHSIAGYTDVSGLDRIGIPTLILWGDKDTIALPEFAYRFESELPNATLRMYPGVGHMLMMENPDESVNDLRAFLSEIESPAQPHSEASGTLPE